MNKKKSLKKVNNKNGGLTQRQQRFVQEYLIDMNAKQAAIRAGFSKHSAEVIGCRNLSNIKVQAAIYRAKLRLAKRVEIKQERVLNELAMIGFADLKDFVDYNEKTGLVEIKDLSKIKKGETRVLKSIKATQGRRKGKSGETLIFEKRQIELCDKLGALRQIGEHIGMFDPRLRIDGTLKTENKLIIEVVPAAPKPPAKKIEAKDVPQLEEKTDGK